MQLYIPRFIWKTNTKLTYQSDQLDEEHIIFKRFFGHSNYEMMVSNFASRLSKLIERSRMTNIEGRYWS